MGMEEVPKEALERYLALGKELKFIRETSANKFFKPYDKQRQFLHSKNKIKVLFGANQVGKTHTEAYEVSLHLTGEYPDDWRGVRFDRPVVIWVAGETTFRVRDTMQVKLFGELGNLGTGMIPLGNIDESKIINKPGIPFAIDKGRIKHKSGGDSEIQFFSYDMGRKKFQGSQVSWIWFDEEPPDEIYGECKMRLLTTGGHIAFTFTPLSGITPLYDHLTHKEEIHKTWLTIDDVKHLNLKEIDQLYEGMSESEKTARKYGVATQGSGKVFQFEEHEYITEDFEIPPHWRKIGGLDIGLNHPTAAVMLAIDDQAGCFYICQEYEQGGESPISHSAYLKNWRIEFAIDPNAFNREIGSKISPASLYRSEGLRVFRGINDVQPSIDKIRMLMSEGRFWIFESCQKLIKEMRMYRTKEGADGKQKIVKIQDDLVDAMRYAVMSSDKAGMYGKIESSDIKVVEFRPSNSKYGGS